MLISVIEYVPASPALIDAGPVLTGLPMDGGADRRRRDRRRLAGHHDERPVALLRREQPVDVAGLGLAGESREGRHRRRRDGPREDARAARRQRSRTGRRQRARVVRVVLEADVKLHGDVVDVAGHARDGRVQRVGARDGPARRDVEADDGADAARLRRIEDDADDLRRQQQVPEHVETPARVSARRDRRARREVLVRRAGGEGRAAVVGDRSDGRQDDLRQRRLREDVARRVVNDARERRPLAAARRLVLQRLGKPLDQERVRARVVGAKLAVDEHRDARVGDRGRKPDRIAGRHQQIVRL
jgi:hypothetical protein